MLDIAKEKRSGSKEGFFTAGEFGRSQSLSAVTG